MNTEKASLEGIMSPETPKIDEEALAKQEAHEKTKEPPTEPSAKREPEQIKDAKGTVFDPEIHVSENGKPVFNTGKRRKGTFKQKRGRKAGGPQKKKREPAKQVEKEEAPKKEEPQKEAQKSELPPPETVFPGMTPPPAQSLEPAPVSEAEATAAQMSAFALMPKELIFGKEVTPVQKKAMDRAFLRWCEKHGFKEPPPWIDIAMAMGLVYREELGALVTRKETQAKAFVFLSKTFGWIPKLFKGRKKEKSQKERPETSEKPKPAPQSLDPFPSDPSFEPGR